MQDMKNIFTRAGLTLGLIMTLTAGGSALAQQQQPSSPQAEGKAERHGRGGFGHKRHGRGMGRGMKGAFLRDLNLTDAQKEQLRAIHERYRATFDAKRQERRQFFEQRGEGGTLTEEQRARAQAFRQEMRETSERMHNEILAVLTPEQRTQLEQKRQEAEQRRQEFRQRREQRRQQRQQQMPNTLQ